MRHITAARPTYIATGAAKPGAKWAPEAAYASVPAVERAPLLKLKEGNACGVAELEVCLDSTGRLIIPGAKRFLPDLPGMAPERLTVKRSGVVFGYTF